MARYIISFGQGHAHMVDQHLFHKDVVAVIEAGTMNEAREKAFQYFGEKWGTSYSEEQFDEKNLIRYFPEGKIYL